MPINWKDPSAGERLLAALVASIGTKVDHNAIAHYFGQGATYGAIEGNFRKIRKLADTLKEEAGVYQGQKAVSASPRKAKTSPVKGTKEGVISGRVTKSRNGTPSKTANPEVATEVDEETMVKEEYDPKMVKKDMKMSYDFE